MRLVGVAAMTAGEELEQAITHRPGSLVPARAVRLAFGQTDENAAGVGALPTVTGMVADRVLAPTSASTRGRTSH